MLTRRSFLTGSALASAALAAPARRAGAGPGVARVFAAGPPAALLVHVLAPRALLGWPSALEPEAREWIGAPAAELPVLGRLAGRGSTVSLETLVALRPDLVLDVGSVGGTYASNAERVRRQTGLRVELLDGRLADSAGLLREAGRLLEVEERGERLAREAERLLAEVARGRERRAAAGVYLARGSDGLETGRAGSITAEVIELVGARNVAALTGPGGLTRVSFEQLLAFEPDYVLTQDPALARSLPSHALWKQLAAVRGGRVLLAPALPFGWIDVPPGVNRLIGALWLARRLDAEGAAAALREPVRAFYDAFYRIALSQAQLERLLGSGA